MKGPTRAMKGAIQRRSFKHVYFFKVVAKEVSRAFLIYTYLVNIICIILIGAYDQGEPAVGYR